MIACAGLGQYEPLGQGAQAVGVLAPVLGFDEPAQEVRSEVHVSGRIDERERAHGTCRTVLSSRGPGRTVLPWQTV